MASDRLLFFVVQVFTFAAALVMYFAFDGPAQMFSLGAAYAMGFSCGHWIACTSIAHRLRAAQRSA